MFVLRPVLQYLSRQMISGTLKFVFQVLSPVGIQKLAQLQSGQFDKTNQRMV